MGVNISSIISRVARYIGDQDEWESYVRISQAEFLDYLIHSVNIIYELKKNDFVKTKIIELQPSKIQELPDEISELSDIIGSVDSSGNVSRISRRVSGRLSDYFEESPCKKNSYVLNNYSYDLTSPRYFQVSPIPKKYGEKIKIKGLIKPKINSSSIEIDMPENFEGCLFELMLYLAFGVDSQDQSYMTRSSFHFNNAMNILGADIKSSTYKYGMKK